jgi:hypothetical protein
VRSVGVSLDRVRHETKRRFKPAVRARAKSRMQSGTRAKSLGPHSRAPCSTCSRRESIRRGHARSVGVVRTAPRTRLARVEPQARFCNKFSEEIRGTRPGRSASVQSGSRFRRRGRLKDVIRRLGALEWRDYYTALSELEVAASMRNSGCAVELIAPVSGAPSPDFRVRLCERFVECECTALIDSDAEQKADAVMDFLFTFPPTDLTGSVRVRFERSTPAQEAFARLSELEHAIIAGSRGRPRNTLALGELCPARQTHCRRRSSLPPHGEFRPRFPIHENTSTSHPRECPRRTQGCFQR